jgi:chaperonin GroEL (HSP60 family)
MNQIPAQYGAIIFCRDPKNQRFQNAAFDLSKVGLLLAMPMYYCAPHAVIQVFLRYEDGKGDCGFNAAATDTFEQLLAAGVIDPAKMVRLALQNPASVSGLMLTTEAMIAEKPKKRKVGVVPDMDSMY